VAQVPQVLDADHRVGAHRGVMKLCVEMVGVVLFTFSFGKLLQFRRAALIVALTAVLETIASMDAGIWAASTLHIAMLVCGMIVMMLLQPRQHCCKFGPRVPRQEGLRHVSPRVIRLVSWTCTSLSE
jgi:hypothetical protein